MRLISHLFAQGRKILGTIYVGFGAAEVDNGDSGTAKTIVLAAGIKQKIRLTGNTTLTLDTTNLEVGPVQVKATQDGTGGRTLAFAGTNYDAARWAGALAAPAVNQAAGAVMFYTFYFDGALLWQSMTPFGVAGNTRPVIAGPGIGIVDDGTNITVSSALGLSSVMAAGNFNY